jgi:hypothetical protein
MLLLIMERLNYIWLSTGDNMKKNRKLMTKQEKLARLVMYLNKIIKRKRPELKIDWYNDYMHIEGGGEDEDEEEFEY